MKLKKINEINSDILRIFSIIFALIFIVFIVIPLSWLIFMVTRKRYFYVSVGDLKSAIIDILELWYQE